MTIWLPTVEGPADLPDLRAWLLHEWRPGTALFAAFAEAPWLIRTLSTAALWWVEPGTCEVLADSAPSIPADFVLDLHDLPTPSGLAIFAVDLEGIDADPAWDVLQGKVRVSGIMWGPITIRLDGTTEVFESISIGTFSRSIFREGTFMTMEDMTVAYPTLARLVASTNEKWPEYGDLFSYLGRSDWLPGACPDSPLPGDMHDTSERTRASKAEDRRLVAALWALTRTTFTEVTTPPIPRPTVRRAKRAGLDPTVRVLSLGGTRIHRTDSEPTESLREHHHSWIVSPHFRWQAHGPGRTERKLILVPAYLKGDPALPLLGADRVWRVLPPRS